MKSLKVVLAGLLIFTLLAGCKKNPVPVESAWEFAIGEKTFTLEGLRAMESITLELSMKGETKSYTGVLLSLLLAEAGIADFETLTLEGADGYSQDITRQEALAANSILCYALEGEDLQIEKSAPLMFASGTASPQTWVGKLKVIRPGK